jgi:DNA-binding SARP family transcriptional activator
VIRVHLAEGNQAGALRQYHLFRRLLENELRLEPSGQMHDLMAELIA